MSETAERADGATGRNQRAVDPDRAGDADGRAVPAVLDPGDARRGAPRERLPAGPGEAAQRADGRVPRQRRPLRADRRVLRAPRRVAVVRPQRGIRAALPVPRLEVRHHGPGHRGPVRAREQQLLRARQADVLPAGQDRRRALDVHGRPRKAAAAARVRVRAGPARADLHLQALAGMQLAAGLRGRHRLQPRVVPALGRAEERPAVQGRQGQRVQHGRPQAVLRGGRLRRRPVRRRAPQRRGRHVLLAHHAVGDAVLHDGAAARRPPDARPLLDPDRRRELLGVHLRLPPGARR